jgi:hypothetical protein
LASSGIVQMRVGHLAVGHRYHPNLRPDIRGGGQSGTGGQELVVGMGRYQHQGT